MPKIAIIISGTRQTRFGDKPAKWLLDIASKRQDMEFELVDLRDFPLPFFDEWPRTPDVAALFPSASGRAV